MRRASVFLIFTLLFATNLIAQNSLDDLNIIFKHDFENDTEGDYLFDEWNNDWLNPAWCERQPELDIASNSSDLVNPTKTLQLNFPANSVGPSEGGTQWWTHFESKNEIYFSYDVYFMPGFQYQLGGKLPSVHGGDATPNIKPNGYDFFHIGLMFKQEGRIVFYVYFPDSKEAISGESFGWGVNDYPDDHFSPSSLVIEYGSGNPVYCYPGEWHNFTFRVVLNTVQSSGGGNYDGILEAYYDGKMVTQISHLLFRHTEELGIEYMNINSFFGGSTDEWRNPIDEWLRIDNVMLYTFNDDIDVPRGNTLSPINRTINYWRKLSATNSEPPTTPGSLASTNRTASTISLKWNDNSTDEYGFKIYRSISEYDGFSEIGSTTANVTTFTDKNLQPDITYYYRIKAFNDVGYSDYSSTISVSTLALQIPAAPTDLNATSVSYSSASLNWDDNSNNETGFEIERNGPNDNNLKKTFTLDADITSFTDAELEVNSAYQYRIRAFNGDGSSDFSSPVQIVTPYLEPPSSPTSLSSSEFTDTSITVTWDDNSTNEKAFIISRSLAINPSNIVEINVNANDTVFTDTKLASSTTYVYTIKAVNDAGPSPASNKYVASTLSLAETHRVKDGLIAYYNFGFDPGFIIHDQSGYGDPLDLEVLKQSAISWNPKSKLNMMSNTALVSILPAKKLIDAVKITNEITIECWIKPFEPEFLANSRILSLANNDYEVGLVMDQVFSSYPNENTLSYSIRLQTSSTNPSGFPEYIPDQTISYINLQHLVYVRDSLGKEVMYINGKKSSEGFRPSNLDTWKNDFHLRLGNESDLNHSWTGSFFLVAIYNKALTQEEINTNYYSGPSDSLLSDGIKYNINVYPNPATDVVNIEMTPQERQDIVPETYIKVLDMFGKIHYQKTIFNPNSSILETIDCKNFSKGFHFLQVISGNQMKTIKLIVQ
jgi:hypothetical protein